jgi:O-antigen ligase
MQAQSLRLLSGIPAPLRAVLVAVGAVLFGLACGRLAVSHYGTAAIALLAGVPLWIAIARRPFLALVCVLLVLCSVFAYETLPRVPLPGHPPITLGDVVVGAAVLGTVWRRPWRTWPPVARRYWWAILGVLVLASVSSVKIATQGTVGLHSAETGYRLVLYLTLALTIGLELSGAQWRRLLDACIIFAALVSILSIVAYASGGVQTFLGNLNPTSATSASETFSAGGSSLVGSGARIRLPGLYFVFAMSIPTLVLALSVRDRWRLMRFGAFLLMIAAIGLSLNRNMYIGVVVGVLVTALLGGGMIRHRFLVAGMATALTVVALVLSAAGTTVTQQVATRATSVLSPSTVVSSNSIQGRAQEFSHGFTMISQHPWVGIGWLQQYGFDVGGVPAPGVENLYLNIALDYGIPAAVVWLLIPGILLAFGIKAARRATRAVDRAMVAAFVGSLVALLLSLLVGTYLQEPTSAAAFAIACGLLLAASLRAMPEQEASAPSSLAAAPPVPV